MPSFSQFFANQSNDQLKHDDEGKIMVVKYNDFVPFVASVWNDHALLNESLYAIV